MATVTYEYKGHMVDFTEVTAIYEEEKEAGRRNGILIHEWRDKNRDGDGIVFGAELPESKEYGQYLLDETCITGYETLNTMEVTE